MKWIFKEKKKIPSNVHILQHRSTYKLNCHFYFLMHLYLEPLHYDVPEHNHKKPEL